MKDDLFKLYVLYELTYKEKYEKSNVDDLFPSDWYNINDYELKIKAISEAINENILIEETKLYKNFKNEYEADILLK